MLDRIFEYQDAISVRQIEAALNSERVRSIFVPEIYGAATKSLLSIVPARRPFFIRKPFSTGKSTELNYIQYLLRAWESKSGEQILFGKLNFDTSSSTWSRKTVHGKICELFGQRADTRGRLAELLDGDSQRRVLMLDDVHRLSDDVLTWLLSGIREVDQLQANGKLRRSLLVVAGNFPPWRLTRRLFPYWPEFKDAAPPRPLTVEDLGHVALEVQALLGTQLSNEWINGASRFSSGDMRVSLMLCHRSIEEQQDLDPSRRVVGMADLDRARSQYFRCHFRSDKRVEIILRNLYDEDGCLKAVGQLSRSGSLEESLISPEVQATLFRLDLLRFNDGELRFKSPFVEELMHTGLQRTRTFQRFSGKHLPSSRLPPAVSRRRRTLRSFLTRGSFRGTLLWIYYGYIISITNDEFEAEIENWEGAEFVIKLPMSTLGRRPRLGSAFIRYSVYHSGGPSEVWLFLGNEGESQDG